ncbi:MAG: transporter [Verrucomicrobia bacterium]|nr:transporter [Verrucomicrobiota bacterium]
MNYCAFLSLAVAVATSHQLDINAASIRSSEEQSVGQDRSQLRLDPPGARRKPASEGNVGGIMDNSFFVEEAYNQEAGVVQHIFNGIYGVDRIAGPDDKSLALVFTQEWPVFSQSHQFSYTVPYYFAETGGQSDNGFGDVLLNYRYQAYFNEDTLRAVAPRFSLVLPTGNNDDGFGDDTAGFQWNVPFSTAVGDRWFAHANAGLTYLPGAGPRPGSDLLHYNLGASAIYAPTRNLHFMLEWIGVWNDGPSISGGMRHEFESIISPGIRRAFDLANDSQLVLGLGVPIGLTSSAPDIGVFLYLSFEHGFLSNKK